jgi:protein phosphatase
MSNKYDIIGDVHGCFDELMELVNKLGYSGYPLEHPEGRQLIFVGDLVGRGPRNKDTVLFVKYLVDTGVAQMVMGNHDNKFGRWLKDNPVKITNGLNLTTEEFADFSEEKKLELSKWILSLPTQLELGDDLMVVHGAPGTKDHNLYGVVTGQKTEDGKPVRLDWAKDYKGPRFCVYGHVMYDEPYLQPFACGINTGCYMTGRLTALRWPEKEFVWTNE